MRVVTVNVNGVRAALTKGFEGWLATAVADVICLQEVRAPDEIVATAFADGWHVVHEASEVKGRAGVAVLSRTPLGAAIIGLPGIAAAPSHTGRWVEATVEGERGPTRVVSVYVHSGQAGTPKMDDKYAFLEAMTVRMRDLLSAYERVVVMGDINIAHTERDIRNAKGNVKTAGFLPEERAYLDRWLAGGWVDVHRAIAGDRDGPYTWWSQRGKAFDNDVGWRLDYQFASPALAATASAARVDRAASWDTRWSDHAPLVIDYSPASS